MQSYQSGNLGAESRDCKLELHKELERTAKAEFLELKKTTKDQDTNENPKAGASNETLSRLTMLIKGDTTWPADPDS
jgi:hypothetical protein